MRLRTIPTALLVVVLIAGVSGAAAGADRTDVIVMLNGDHLTGEILSLSRGQVQLKTDNAGTIAVEWDKIAFIESRRSFTVTTRDGTILIGTLVRADASRSVKLRNDGGDQTLSSERITAIEPLGRSFWAKLTGSVGAGFNYTRSSGVAQFNLDSTTSYRQPAFLAEMNVSATLTEQPGGDGNGGVATGQFMYERYRGKRFFIAGAAQLETNESLGLALRIQGGGLAGARLVNTNRAQFQIGAGLVANEEHGVDVATTQNLEGVVGLKGSYYTYDRPKTNLDANLSYFPSLSNPGRQRLQFSSDIRREVWKDFYVSLSMYDTFDSAPPNATAAHNDIGITTSISWSFGS